jgi:NhaA family Na+:H+ antiporter
MVLIPATLRPTSVLRGFLSSEASGGILLISAAAVALAVANSPAAPAYVAVLHSYIGPLSVLHWVNDALMAVFFFLVGLEIKREFADGNLSRPADRRRCVGHCIGSFAKRHERDGAARAIFVI